MTMRTFLLLIAKASALMLFGIATAMTQVVILNQYGLSLFVWLPIAVGAIAALSPGVKALSKVFEPILVTMFAMVLFNGLMLATGLKA